MDERPWWRPWNGRPSDDPKHPLSRALKVWCGLGAFLVIEIVIAIASR